MFWNERLIIHDNYIHINRVPIRVFHIGNFFILTNKHNIFRILGTEHDFFYLRDWLNLQFMSSKEEIC